MSQSGNHSLKNAGVNIAVILVMGVVAWLLIDHAATAVKGLGRIIFGGEPTVIVKEGQTFFGAPKEVTEIVTASHEFEVLN